VPACASPETDACAYFAERFGVPPETLQRFQFSLRKDELWATTIGKRPDLRTIRPPGLRALRLSAGGYKPTSTFLRILGPAIRRHRIEVALSDLRPLLLGRGLPRPDIEGGYVALVYEGIVIGCGQASRGELRCLLPTAQRQALLEILEGL
jgi:NOL1/NOP2/fmu family ribosome biogenesis protein